MARGWRISLAIAAIGVFAVAAGALIRPQSPLSGDVANDPALVKRGAYLAIAGDCAACHTAGKSVAVYAGGLEMPIPFLGTIRSSNITPAMNTGIGGWSLADFDRALRYGIGKDGRNLYPAMPYVSYAKINDEDVKALYAYFKYGVTAVEKPREAGTIPWLISMRWPVQLWNRMFLDTNRYRPRSDRDADWNRGAYWVQGLAHCGTCHTPRGLALQEIAMTDQDAGYLSGSLLGGWQAYNITSDPKAGIGSWSVEQIAQYLSTGDVAGVGQAAGPMGEAIEHSFSKMTKDDVRAIATYIKTVPPYAGAEPSSRHGLGAPSSAIVKVRGQGVGEDAGTADAAQIYMGACGACHGWSGGGSQDHYYPSLFHNSTVGAANPTNLINVILRGIDRRAGDQAINMPAFAKELSDREVAKLVNFLNGQFGDKSQVVTEADIRKQR